MTTLRSKNMSTVPQLGAALLGGCLLLAAAGDAATVSFNANQTLVVDGKPLFPIGFTAGPPNGSQTPAGKDALQELREAGALLVEMELTNAWDSAAISRQAAALNWAGQQGMLCMVNLRERSAFASGDVAAEASLRSLVNSFKSHSALALWRNYPEAWSNGVPAADLLRGYNVVKQEDANHPVLQAHAPRGGVSDLQPYNPAADALAMSIFPVSYPPGAHSLLANKEISMVGDWANFLSQVAAGQKPRWMIEQIAWSGTRLPSGAIRFPAFEQTRYMAYQAVIRGARGLIFSGGGQPGTLSPADAALGWNWTFWTNVLKPVVQELGQYGALTNALVAPDSTLPITLTGASSPDIEFCVREAYPYLYILACKREGATIQATFNGLPSSISSGELLYEAPRAVTVQSGTFTDWFGPFEVHAYRFYNTNVVTQTNQWPLYESFNYSNIGMPVSSNTPANWDHGGSGANDLSVVSGNLTYAGLAAPVGNSVTNGGVGLGVRRLFGTNFASGQVFFSALFRMNNMGYGSWDGASTWVGALTATDNTSFRLGIMAKSNTPTSYVIGVQKTAPAVYSTTEFHAGETVFLVGRYDFTVSPNQVTLWINPDPATFGAASPPATGAFSSSTGSDGFVIDRFNMRQNTATSVPAAMQWDELRFGNTWSQVTPD